MDDCQKLVIAGDWSDASGGLDLAVHRLLQPEGLERPVRVRAFGIMDGDKAAQLRPALRRGRDSCHGLQQPVGQAVPFDPQQVTGRQMRQQRFGAFLRGDS